MKIVKPSVEVYFHHPYAGLNVPGTDGDGYFSPKVFLEKVGRTCYKSEDKITEDSAPKFITMLNERGHHAMLEHCFASVKFITDRGVLAELTRHRICSFAVESTRYCNYTKEKFGNEISVIEPPEIRKRDDNEFIYWKRSCEEAEKSYTSLIADGISPQIARSVLPTCLKTEIWCSANLREWMHIFNLRCSPQAHPQIREVMMMALKQFATEVPEMFRSIWDKYKL